MKALSNVFTQKFFLYFIFSMLYYYRKVGKVMAFIVGCLVGLLFGVLGSVVAKAIKESNF
jgi:H+/Cl- antiporter ClcA